MRGGSWSPDCFQWGSLCRLSIALVTLYDKTYMIREQLHVWPCTAEFLKECSFCLAVILVFVVTLILRMHFIMISISHACIH